MRSRINKRVSKSNGNIKNLFKNIEIDYIFLTKIACIVILYVIIFFGMSSFFMRSIAIKSFENSVENFAVKNLDTVFEIRDVLLYTSASAKNNEQNIGMNISTFTDISFNIDNPKGKTINSLKIDNLNIYSAPEIGEPAIGYKNPLDFGKFTNSELNSTDKINFNVLDKETDNFENPIVYNNLSSPITLTYINKNVAKNFQVRKNETSIYYDGRLLKSANVDLTKLSAKVSFEITITTSLEEEYKCKVFMNIPYKTDTSSVLDGYLLQELPLAGTAKFYQI